MSLYKKSQQQQQHQHEVKPKTKVSCKSCGSETERFVWNKRQRRTIECDQCLPCWKKANLKKEKNQEKQQDSTKKGDETSALLIGEISDQAKEQAVVESSSSLYIGTLSSAVTSDAEALAELDPQAEEGPESLVTDVVELPPEAQTPEIADLQPTAVEPSTAGERNADACAGDDDPKALEISAAPDKANGKCHQSEVNEVILDHHIFDTHDGWRKAESMSHPTLNLQLSTDPSDYAHLNIPCPEVKPKEVSTVTDTGAQSCLWGLLGFYACGFKDSDLRPVRRTIRAANREEIEIAGAILLCLTGTADDSTTHTARVMVYVSPSTRKFYLSREALIQLKVIPPDFPKVGSAAKASSELHASAIASDVAPCGCPVRKLPPGMPDKLLFEPCPENIEPMKAWLLDRYKDSTLNQCTH